MEIIGMIPRKLKFFCDLTVGVLGRYRGEKVFPPPILSFKGGFIDRDLFMLDKIQRMLQSKQNPGPKFVNRSERGPTLKW